jgi:hypothetical protein
MIWNALALTPLNRRGVTEQNYEGCNAQGGCHERRDKASARHATGGEISGWRKEVGWREHATARGAHAHQQEKAKRD